MTHLVIGYPTLKDTVRLAITMERSGSDFLELQIPFSDPIADGPIIMNACEESLKGGSRVVDYFHTIQEIAQQIRIPLFLMGYYNTVFTYGVEKFICQAKQVGCAGLIVPDIPPEEETYERFIFYCNYYNLNHIRVLSQLVLWKELK